MTDKPACDSQNCANQDRRFKPNETPVEQTTETTAFPPKTTRDWNNWSIPLDQDLPLTTQDLPQESGSSIMQESALNNSFFLFFATLQSDRMVSVLTVVTYMKKKIVFKKKMMK